MNLDLAAIRALLHTAAGRIHAAQVVYVEDISEIALSVIAPLADDVILMVEQLEIAKNLLQRARPSCSRWNPVGDEIDRFLGSLK